MRVKHQVVADSADILGEKIPEPVMQHVVVGRMSAWVDSPGIAGNAKPFSSLLPRQQAMHGRGKMLWEKKDEEPIKGSDTLKVIGCPQKPFVKLRRLYARTLSQSHGDIEPADTQRLSLQNQH